MVGITHQSEDAKNLQKYLGMRIRRLQTFFALVLGPYFLSCATTTTFPQVDYDAAPIHRPIRLAEPREDEREQIVFRGSYSKGKRETLTTDAESFRWGVPGYHAGLEIELAGPTSSMALGFSKADFGKRQLSQTHFGFGYNFSTDEIGQRIDGTLHFSET